MELGNFLGKLKGNKQEEPKKFLALILTDEVVQASVWSVVNEATEIISIGTPVEWDGDVGTTSELITAVDATISSATEGLGEDPSDVILGIPHSWTDKSGVLGVKKDFIVKIRKELELNIIGYVVITDSVISYLKLQEGTPSTSIIIQVSRDELTILLVKLGRVEAIEIIGRSDDVVKDVEEGIARFKVLDNLPSRIILFNSMHNLDDIIQNLLSTDWATQFNFLHTPKIEALQKDVAIRALSVAGGSEVAKSLGFSVSNTTVSPKEDDSVVEQSEEVLVSDVQQETSDESELESEAPTVEDSNIEPVSDDTFLSSKEIGFGVEEAEEVEQVLPKQEIAEDVEEEVEEEITPAKPAKSLKLPKLNFALPSFTLPKLALPKLKGAWLVALLSVLLVFGAGFYLIWFLPKATVTVSVIPKNLDETVKLTLSRNVSSVDFDAAIVPVEAIELTQTGEKMIETTGKKIVGESAVGEVTIYNRTSANKTFTKGTLISSGSLKFTLDSDVSVASKSAGSDYVDVPGKANVAVTAQAIGTDSNLKEGTEFTIQSFGKDSYVAKNDAALKGGTSEEILVVSKEDQSNLTKELTASLMQELKAQTQTNLDPTYGVYLVEDQLKTKDPVFSAKVGEQAKSLSLTMTVTGTILRYKLEDVTNLVNSQIDAAIPSGYIRANLPSNVTLSGSITSEDGTKVTSTANVSVSLLPLINSDQILSFLKGKKPSTIETILRDSIPGYQSALVSITPSALPTKLKMIPNNKQNIKLIISPQTQ